MPDAVATIKVQIDTAGAQGTAGSNSSGQRQPTGGSSLTPAIAAATAYAYGQQKGGYSFKQWQADAKRQGEMTVRAKERGEAAAERLMNPNMSEREVFNNISAMSPKTQLDLFPQQSLNEQYKKFAQGMGSWKWMKGVDVKKEFLDEMNFIKNNTWYGKAAVGISGGFGATVKAVAATYIAARIAEKIENGAIYASEYASSDEWKSSGHDGQLRRSSALSDKMAGGARKMAELLIQPAAATKAVGIDLQVASSRAIFGDSPVTGTDLQTFNNIRALEALNDRVERDKIRLENRLAARMLGARGLTNR